MGERQKTWRRFVTPQVILLALAILVGLIVLLASMFAGLFSPLEQAVIAIISGLAGAQLANNYSAIKQETRLELHERTQQEILHALRNFPVGLLTPREALMPLPEYAESATAILIVGRTLGKISAHTNFLRDQLERGCRLRFVMMNPDAFGRNDLEPVMPNSLGLSEALDLYKAELTFALANFQRLYGLSRQTIGTVEIRLVDYVSNLSFVVVDDEEGLGKIVVDLMPYKIDEWSRPCFEVRASDPNPGWYDLFRGVCETIWERARPWRGESLSC